jgi:hypothetical protein
VIPSGIRALLLREAERQASDHRVHRPGASSQLASPRSSKSRPASELDELRQRGVRAGKHNRFRRRRESRRDRARVVVGVELQMHRDGGVCSNGRAEPIAFFSSAANAGTLCNRRPACGMDELRNYTEAWANFPSSRLRKSGSVTQPPTASSSSTRAIRTRLMATESTGPAASPPDDQRRCAAGFSLAILD